MKNRLVSGVSITEFAKIIGRPNQYASVIALRLQKGGFVSLQKDYDPVSHRRITKITLTKVDISPQELQMAALPGTRPRDNNFIAPDISPRIREVVNLRLAGHSQREIADKLGVSQGTVGMYLGYARHPENYVKSNQKREINITSNIDHINKLLEKDGFVSSDTSTVSHFSQVFKHYRDTESAKCVDFPYQKKFYGSLAGTRAIYSSRKKFADFVASKLYQDVFANFTGYRIKKGGKSRSTRGISISLSGTFHTDKQIVPAIWEKLKDLGLKIDSKHNIQVDSNESSINLTNEEMLRMNEITANLQMALTSPGNIYKHCKAFTNFFERIARKHGFEPSKVLIDKGSAKLNPE